jgi:hypothetical protein
MSQNFTKLILVPLFICIIGSNVGYSQNSVLVNFGTTDCYLSSSPAFSFIKNPLGASPSVISSCNVSAQEIDIYGVFVAYNPKNNKIYMADIRDGIDTKVWIIDMGLPSNITCPLIPAFPTYTLNYVSNNFEFDNNGNLWSLSNYNSATGRCSIDELDVTTGTVLSTRLLQFPVGAYPNTIFTGDICITTNGRMFATLGDSPSRLYEISNYSATGTIGATYLQTLPNVCYGIAYLNGQLELTGSDFSNCYYFNYSISGNTLGGQTTFQNNQSPIDNTSITPSIGVTKQLLNATTINSNTADLSYEVYVRNMGNTVLNNVNVADNLGTAFGAANVSNVTTSFSPGGNPAGLTLNASYNGTTNTLLLNSGQTLANYTTSNPYYFKIQVNCRVTNLISGTTYYNSAVGQGTLGTGITLTNVADSSNNGASTVIDPNNNGNPGDLNENIPTPFNFSLVPINFINITASFVNKTTSVVRWAVATPTVNANKFEIEFSTDGRLWTMLGTLPINNPNQGHYQFVHQSIPLGTLYYRIKEIDNNGPYVYSRIALLNNKADGSDFVIFPNPANNYIQISAPKNTILDKTTIELYDAKGRKLLQKQLTASSMEINIGTLPDGNYVIKVISSEKVTTQKLLILH